jgi:FAD/FMN-containing dehydrogenase/Fe-S oxidoreductase
MPQKSPHISISDKKLVDRVLKSSQEEFQGLPRYVQDIAAGLASEFFIIRYNPFIPPDEVARSVFSRLEAEKPGLDEQSYRFVKQGLQRFWDEFRSDRRFRDTIIHRLRQLLPEEHIVTSPNTLVECATDATDLRMEIPLLLVAPSGTEEVREIIELARELGFGIIPRGGGSGLTGGAVPAVQRCVVLSMSRMKTIQAVDPDSKTLRAQAGVITLDAIRAAEDKDLLFTVDPASKAASSLGGNISENAGGPFAFEYGTTLDNVLDYTMVLPTGEIIRVRRREHPWHKILPWETAVFDILDEQDRLKDSISLQGHEIRSPGLGKDVTNKFLGGLPGIQKEGVDGVITEACFTLHDRLAHSRSLCLEFFGNSMHHAMLVIEDLVKLRDRIRIKGDLVKMSALEEFGSKYVQAIKYRKKSVRYEGEPISVLLVQLDSGDETALDGAVAEITEIAEHYHNVDVFVAESPEEAEAFWQDRHRLSAITRRTSGFKINEDVVIPIDVIPEFSDFIESLNLYYLALAYRQALNQATRLEGVDPADEFIDMELGVASGVLGGKVTTQELSEQEFELQIHYFFRDLISRHPEQAESLESIEKGTLDDRIVIANHMHAGDGNCHVNIPVKSNDPEMMRLAEEAAQKVFSKVVELNGTISGEHGIGITKIGFLAPDRIRALQEYKQHLDPDNIFNPGKLTQSKLTVDPYTFSFNRLIQDLEQISLAHKERLISLLRNIQVCSRCGKCKQYCPMYYPEQGFLYHPRNKIITLGALVEALYYTQVDQGRPNRDVMRNLQDILERCTACGKCMAVCPVKINMPEQVLNMRSFLEEKGQGGTHPIKTSILHYLTRKPQWISRAAKAASVGQQLQSRTVASLPAGWRNRFQNPLLRGAQPPVGFKNLADALKLNKNNIFTANPHNSSRDRECVLYFPGCGAGLFYRDIGLAAMHLLHRELGVHVVLPDEHLCCGYPLLAAGCSDDYDINRNRNIEVLQRILADAEERGLHIRAVLTACGTCREALHSYDLQRLLDRELEHMDAVQYALQVMPESTAEKLLHAGDTHGRAVLFHPSCHSEWSGMSPEKSGRVYAGKLQELLGRRVAISPGCCGESGLGALTSPHIYNIIRERKRRQLRSDLADQPQDQPVLVGCPSCKVGLQRIALQEDPDRPVLHVLEYLALQTGGETWKQDLLRELGQKGKSRERSAGGNGLPLEKN